MNLAWAGVVLVLGLVAAAVILIITGHSDQGVPVLTAALGLTAGAAGGTVHGRNTPTPT